MKAFLMYRDQDFDLHCNLPDNAPSLIQDLGLDTLFNAMASGDEFLLNVATKAVLTGLTDVDTIIYRQNILQDCLANPDIVREIYALTLETIEKWKKAYWFAFNRPSLYSLTEVLQIFVDIFKKMRAIVDKHSEKFVSQGFTALFAMLKRELSDEYFTIVQNHLNELKFSDGVLISAELGEGNKGANYILRKSSDKKQAGSNESLLQKHRFTPFR